MTPVSDNAPEQFGPYEVYERLGLGGMATVYRAKKRGPAGFERSVALKRMLSHLAEDPAFVESFVREAKVASLLQHPNIAQVYDFGRISGTYYIAMELVAGFDVRKLLRHANRANEAIPLPVILSILGELCDALDYAHTFVDEAGQPLHIVHRDVSPSNMIVAHTGHLKVIDFGIAKAHGRSLHTESGQVKGKLGYMSPEVALGMAVGPVSDIFSVGVVAWELVTASPLFSARTDFETMRRIREEPIASPSQLNPACPPALDQLILSALERDADRRLTSARLFRRALDQIAVETGSQISARRVADWMRELAHPDALARAATVVATSTIEPGGSIPSLAAPGARGRAPTSRPLPMGVEPPTAVLRTPRPAAAPLRRSTEHIQLASEIWGDDARTAGDSVPGGVADFHRHVADPPPLQMPSSSALAASAASSIRADAPDRTSSLRSAASGASSVLAAAPRSPSASVPARRANGTLLVAIGVALVAAVAGGVLLSTRKSGAPKNGALRFEIDPVGARVLIAGTEVGRTSPLDTELAPGVYPIAVELDGYAPWTSTITVRDGERQTIHVALDKDEPELVRDEPAVVAAQDAPEAPVPEPPEPPDAGATDEPKEPARGATAKATKREGKRGRTAEKSKPVNETAKLDKDEDEDDDRPAPAPKPEPPKPEPAVAEPPKPAETRPARTPLVAANAVTKLAGEVPILHARTAKDGGAVLAKMCIDDQGRVSSVKIVKANPEIASDLQAALASWRYKPYLRDGKPSPVCFPLSLRVVVRSR